jgi:hypothetical protein
VLVASQRGGTDDAPYDGVEGDYGYPAGADHCQRVPGPVKPHGLSLCSISPLHSVVTGEGRHSVPTTFTVVQPFRG